MSYIWDQLSSAIPLIVNRNGYVVGLLWVTIRVALVSTSAAVVIGLPLGVALGIGRFRGRRALQLLANASLALPSVVVGVGVLLLLLRQGALGSLHLAFTLRAVYIAQAILALPFIVALTPAAIQGLAPGLLDQARALGAGRVQLATFALREAKIGVVAAVIAALGAAISEVGAVVIVGSNIQGHDETLASALLDQFNYTSHDPYEVAIALVLLALIALLIGTLTVIQQRTGAVQFRFRTA
ncbi:MAG TPA: ABC transporter permease [Solirubrobacteraceae bacterium]|nr:ABC transporter permease [Solirubrobacteraceae bacterium]